MDSQRALCEESLVKRTQEITSQHAKFTGQERKRQKIQQKTDVTAIEMVCDLETRQSYYC